MKKVILSILFVVSATFSLLFGQTLIKNDNCYNGWGTNANGIKWDAKGAWTQWNGSVFLAGQVSATAQTSGNVWFIGTSKGPDSTASIGKVAYFIDDANNKNYNDDVLYPTGGFTAAEYRRLYGATNTSAKGIFIQNGNSGGSASVRPVNVDLNGDDETITRTREFQISASNNTNNTVTANLDMTINGSTTVHTGLLSFRMLFNTAFNNLLGSTIPSRTFSVSIVNGIVLKNTGTAILVGSTRNQPTRSDIYQDYVQNIALGTAHASGDYAIDEYSIKLEGTGVIELASQGSITINNRVLTDEGSMLFLSVIPENLIFKDSVSINGDAIFKSLAGNLWEGKITFAGDKNVNFNGSVDFSVLSNAKSRLKFTGLDALTNNKVVMTWNTLKGISVADLISKANADKESTQKGTFVLGSEGKSIIYDIGKPVVGPVITRQPDSRSIYQGESVTFNVDATGRGVLVYQWQISSNGTTWIDIVGATGKEYSLTNVQVEYNNKYFRCKVTDADTYAYTMNAKLVVEVPSPPPVITSQPQDASVVQHTPVTFGIVAIGADLSYLWEISKDNGTTWEKASGTATATTYSIDDATIDMDGYMYRCKVINPYGTAISRTVVLNVTGTETSPVITTQPISQKANVGTDVTFTVKATGGSLEYQWYESQVGSASWVTMSGETNDTLTLQNVQSEISGYKYRCEVFNTHGLATSSVATLEVVIPIDAPVFISEPTTQVLRVGSPAKFAVVVEGFSLNYQWQVCMDGVTWINVTGATGAALLIPQITAGMENYRYRCIVSNPAATIISSSASIVLNKTPYTVYYVKTGGNNSASGKTWDAALNSISVAFEKAVSGDEIWVAGGTYICDNVLVKSGVSLYGSFSGREKSIGERSEGSNKTTLKGSGKVADGHILVCTGTTGAKIDGFSITNGLNCGIFGNTVENAQITNCTFVGNLFGIGLLGATNSLIENCNISSTKIDAVHFEGGTGNIVRGCSLTGTGISTSYEASGVYNYGSTNLLVEKCDIISNSFYGLYITALTTVTNCNIQGNGQYGIYNYRGVIHVKDSTIVRSPDGIYTLSGGDCTYTNTTFSLSSKSGLTNERSSGNIIVNCSFIGNTGVAIHQLGGSSSTIVNTLIWGNGRSIYNEAMIDSASAYYSVIAGGYDQGEEIITDDPKLGKLGNYGGFVNVMPVLAGSSAIEKGALTSQIPIGSSIVIPSTDARGYSRSQPCTIGAFEYIITPSITKNISNFDAFTGKSYTLSIGAAGNAITYQWQQFVSGNWVDMFGETSENLTFPEITYDLNGTKYRCLVRNSMNVMVSTEAIMTVRESVNIETHPSSITVNVKTPAVFTIEATGYNIKYQWQYSENGVTWINVGTSRDTYSYTPPSVSSNGRLFRCLVSNGGGTEVSRLATLTVKNLPIITSNIGDVEIYSGNDEALLIKAKSLAGDIVYQWQELINGVWVNISQGEMLILKDAQVSGSGRQFRCVLTNNDGETVSNISTITVRATASITKQPFDVIGYSGRSAEFDIIATGYNIKYQWQISKDGIKWTDIKGENTDSLTLDNLKLDQDGEKYRCVVSNGGAVVTSTPATLTVRECVVIEDQPYRYKSDQGNLEVGASGYELGYLWEKSNDDGQTWIIVSGANTNMLNLNPTDFANGILYRCGVYNTVAKLNLTYTYKIVPSDLSLYLTSEPMSAVLYEKSSTTFVASAVSESGAVKYTWMVSKDGGVTWANAGSTANTLKITAVLDMDGWQYKCVVSNGTDTLETDSASLTVFGLVVIKKQPIISPTYNGDNAKISIEAEGHLLNYQWQVYVQDATTKKWEWIDIVDGASYTGALTDTLYALDVPISMSGTQYRCIIKNTGNTITSSVAKLVVNQKVVIVTQPVSQQIKEIGENVSFVVKANGTAPITYQWQVFDVSVNEFIDITVEVAQEYGISSASKSATYSLSKLTKNQDGLYFRCVVKNNGSSEISEVANVIVNANTAVITPVTSASTFKNSSCEISVIANAEPYIAYRWEMYKLVPDPKNINKQIWAWDKYYEGVVSEYVSEKELILEIGGYDLYSTSAKFRCAVKTNMPNAREVYSKEIVVNVCDIVTQPVSQVKETNESVTFSVKTSGAGLTYQWQRYDSSSSSWVNVDGANATSLTFSKLNSEYDGSEYRCVITNNYVNPDGVGKKSIISDTVSLAVNSTTVVTTPLTSVLLFNDGENTLSVKARADQTVAYQWQKYAINPDTGRWEWMDIAGESGEKPCDGINDVELYLKILASEYEAGMKYRCAVKSGRVSGSKVVYSKDIIIRLCDRTIVSINSSVNNPQAFYYGDYAGLNAVDYQAILAITAKGLSLTYEWQEFNGTEWVKTQGSGVTTNKLTTPRLEVVDFVKKYRCAVINTGGVVYSPEITILRMEAAGIVTSPENVKCTNMETATFTVVPTLASGNPSKLTYQWQVSSDSGNTWKSQSSGKQSLVITKPSIALDGNMYRCLVSNAANKGAPSVSGMALLDVVPVATISSQPKSMTSYQTGNAEFTVTAKGEDLQYQWQYSTDGGKTWINVTGVDSSKSTLSLSNIAYANGTMFRCLVWNETQTQAKATSTSSAKLTVQAKLVISSLEATQSGSSIICDGVTPVVVYADKAYPFSLKVNVTGYSPKYQWYNEDGIIKGATGAIYRVSDPSILVGQKIWCVVYNTLGNEVNSVLATLDVKASFALSSLAGQGFTMKVKTSSPVQSIDNLSLIAIDSVNLRAVNTTLANIAYTYTKASYSYKRLTPTTASFTMNLTGENAATYAYKGTLTYSQNMKAVFEGTYTYKLGATTITSQIVADVTNTEGNRAKTSILGDTFAFTMFQLPSTQLDKIVVTPVDGKNCKIYVTSSMYSVTDYECDGTYTYVKKSNNVAILSLKFTFVVMPINISELAIVMDTTASGQFKSSTNPVNGAGSGMGVFLISTPSGYSAISSSMMAYGIDEVPSSESLLSSEEDWLMSYDSDAMFNLLDGALYILTSMDNDGLSMDEVIVNDVSYAGVSIVDYNDWFILGSLITVNATGSDLQYQWYRSKDGMTFTAIEGGTGSTCIATGAGVTYYECKVYNSKNAVVTKVLKFKSE